MYKAKVYFQKTKSISRLIDHFQLVDRKQFLSLIHCKVIYKCVFTHYKAITLTNEGESNKQFKIKGIALDSKTLIEILTCPSQKHLKGFSIVLFVIVE